jgi:hypothetical protein
VLLHGAFGHATHGSSETLSDLVIAGFRPCDGVRAGSATSILKAWVFATTLALVRPLYDVCLVKPAMFKLIAALSVEAAYPQVVLKLLWLAELDPVFKIYMHTSAQ